MHTDDLHKLEYFFDAVAFGASKNGLVWSGRHKDKGTGVQVYTAALPVFDRSRKPPRAFGVVARNVEAVSPPFLWLHGSSPTKREHTCGTS